jgi:cobalt-zinc-cadmium efflux system outer membrane protein
MHLLAGLRLAAVCLVVRGAAAQPTPPAETPVTPVTRTQAVATALERGARLGVARADTALSYAQLLTARAWQNPALSTVYSKSTPQWHVTADVPFDYPSLRGARVRAAQAGRTAARYRFAFERAAVALTADTAYTRALAARERLRLSRRNAAAADTLQLIAAKRRDAGDASDLDVELATVNAAQQTNAALTDSLAYVSAVLDLQSAMGLASDGVAVVLADSLGAPPSDVPDGQDGDGAAAAPLSVAAAQASVEAARLGTLVERRGVWAAPSLTAGFETGDPSGGEPGILPTVGISLPLPLLNRNRGPIAQAEAERLRAQAELTLAQVESRTEIARARRELAVSLDKVRRDQALVAAATRVATMSQTAYREGASALPAVLEAQRNARDVLAQYVADLADAWVASAELRVLTLTSDLAR